MNRKRSNTFWGYFFIAPQLIGLLSFSLIPLITTFVLSTLDWDGFQPATFIGFNNFSYAFHNPDFQKALVNTLYYSLLTVPMGIFLAILVAVALNKVRYRVMYRLFFFMPVVTSSVAVAIVWMWLLNGDFGIINFLLHSLFGIKGPQWLTNLNLVLPSLAIVSIWQKLGFNMIIFLAGLQGISRDYYEASMIDGASRSQQFWKITVPLLSPTTLFVTIIGIIDSFKIFDTAFVMTSGGPAKASYTIVYHLYELAFKNFQFGRSAAAATMLFVIILTFTIAQTYISRKWVHYAD
ncbi:multiple sugar transport system permease protein [Paenibacillus sp. V4I3]|jgi:multiple sugar transport system permease protein|uniref:Sugar ABC transporter permease n=2 Tax=Paenibacillus TaxID=44249 RepID=A0ABT4GME5_9BACL|nr:MULTISPECIES: sugar ABC transporter permease [Paenibacillus]KRE36260.1 sugar ABC transporter permease [Paenibacillus sp. Soil724D2]KRF31723.1 sugar ABC transporter permease [Paenibacillus sp. Soil787]MCY9697173.1 sugar ABC transporter permease [Paenibacillus alginolyticus]MDQ0877422.1 multiple sugar transport system permease protein [Paenibacillus sp. V4I3]MDQ0886713.1 multiple sugar transport system permease protein [Paenibacillus sp. V4I9]